MGSGSLLCESRADSESADGDPHQVETGGPLIMLLSYDRNLAAADHGKPLSWYKAGV